MCANIFNNKFIVNLFSQFIFLHFRLSKSKDTPKPSVRVISIPSFSQDVQLHKAENAWTPGIANKKAGVVESSEDDISDLTKKVRAILNKLTPQKFEVLVQKFKDLPIDSEPKLKVCMELIFEKAVDEPSFSVAYAQMCQSLMKKSIVVKDNTEQKEVSFKKLLITRVQQEFVKDYMNDVDREGHEAKMEDPNLSEEEKKLARDMFMALEMKARRRSLGNIRFIGELYKLEMLTCKSMHECVTKLLKTTDDESIECLCRLITTVGQFLEKETVKKLQAIPKEKLQGQGIREFTYYFNEMKKIISEKVVSARVRFLMQDVVDLRANNWQKRREDAGPKTIEEIHAQAKKEQLSEKLNMYNPSTPTPRRDEVRKRPQKSVSSDQSDQGEWQVPTRAAKNTLEKIDPSRVRKMVNYRVDIDSFQLGPGSSRGPSGFGNWANGSAGPKSSRQEETTMQNRFAAFGGESSNPAYEGRTSGGYSSRPGSRPGSYVGRGSRGHSVENDKAKALQAVKEMNPGGVGRSTSTILPRDSERGPAVTKSSSMMAPPASSPSETQLRGRSTESREDLDKITKGLIDEFLGVCDFNEAVTCIIEKFHPTNISWFVEQSLNDVIDSKEKNQRNVGSLFSHFIKKGVMKPDNYLEGLNKFLEFAPDIIVDVPRIWEFLAIILSPGLLDETLALNLLEQSVEVLRAVDAPSCGKFMGTVSRELAKQNEERASLLWTKSGLSWPKILGASVDVDEFVK